MNPARRNYRAARVEDVACFECRFARRSMIPGTSEGNVKLTRSRDELRCRRDGGEVAQFKTCDKAESWIFEGLIA